jgi:hypothetical protein
VALAIQFITDSEAHMLVYLLEVPWTVLYSQSAKSLGAKVFVDWNDY